MQTSITTDIIADAASVYDTTSVTNYGPIVLLLG